MLLLSRILSRLYEHLFKKNTICSFYIMLRSVSMTRKLEANCNVYFSNFKDDFRFLFYFTFFFIIIENIFNCSWWSFQEKMRLILYYNKHKQ